MLKENPRSLRLYFAFIAGLSLLPVATAVIRGQFSDLVSWSMLVDFAFGGLFAYVAVRFDRLLRKPAPIKGVLIVGMASAVLSFAASVRNGLPTKEVVVFILSVLLFVYLMKNVTRLSQEAPATPGALPPA